MGITLEEERQAGPPSVKLRNVGDYVDVAIVRTEPKPWLEFGTNEPKIGKDGKPRTQDCVTALVIGGTGVVTENETDVQVQPEQVVTLWLSGASRWEFIEAKKALGRGLQVGDVMRWKFDRTEPGAYASNPKKVRTCQLRAPKPEEQARTTKCEELYRNATAINLEPAHDPAPF